jgi:hypothetical protein
MKRIDTQIDIDATPGRVWGVLTDFAAYPSWNPFIREISGTPTVGAQLTVRIQSPDRSAMTFKPRVLHANGNELRWRGQLIFRGLFDGEHIFQLAYRSGGCRFVQAEDFSGVLVPMMGSRLLEDTRRGFEAMNRALKERAEKAL